MQKPHVVLVGDGESHEKADSIDTSWFDDLLESIVVIVGVDRAMKGRSGHVAVNSSDSFVSEFANSRCRVFVSFPPTPRSSSAPETENPDRARARSRSLGSTVSVVEPPMKLNRPRFGTTFGTPQLHESGTLVNPAS